MEGKMYTFNEKEFNNGLMLLDDIVESANLQEGVSKDQALKEGLVQFYDYIIANAGIDFNNITKYIANRLGMKNIDDNIYLIPLWLMPILPDGLEVITMDGQKIKYYSSSNKCEKYGIRIVS